MENVGKYPTPRPGRDSPRLARACAKSNSHHAVPERGTSTHSSSCVLEGGLLGASSLEPRAEQSHDADPRIHTSGVRSNTLIALPRPGCVSASCRLLGLVGTELSVRRLLIGAEEKQSEFALGMVEMLGAS